MDSLEFSQRFLSFLNENMSYAGVLSFICEEKNRNVQGFDHVTFLIKVEQKDDNQAILYFLDNDPITECDIPE
ncbi:13975_t:CDS:2, partial [Racocetra persica]